MKLPEIQQAIAYLPYVEFEHNGKTVAVRLNLHLNETPPFCSFIVSVGASNTFLDTTEFWQDAPLEAFKDPKFYDDVRKTAERL